MFGHTQIFDSIIERNNSSTSIFIIQNKYNRFIIFVNYFQISHQQLIEGINVLNVILDIAVGLLEFACD